MENSIYTVEYFIKKFQNIPEDEIGTGNTNQHCALFHVGIIDYVDKPNDEATALMMLFGWDGYDIWSHRAYPIVYEVNDGNGEYGNKYGYLKTPKERILKKLYDIYEKTYGRKYGEQEHPKEKVIYKTVVIDSAVKELQETLTEN